MRKIRVPADWRAFTVGQWMKAASNTENPVGLVAAMSNYRKEELATLPKHVLDSAADQVRQILNQQPTRIYKYITLDGVQFDFIDHWEELTTAEYVDLEHFGGDLTKNAHKFLSVCYRPSERKWFGRKMVPYEGPVTADRMRKIPASVLAGALVFFYISKESYLTTSVRLLAGAGQEILSPSTTGGTTSSTKSQVNVPRI